MFISIILTFCLDNKLRFAKQEVTESGTNKIKRNTEIVQQPKATLPKFANFYIPDFISAVAHILKAVNGKKS